MIVIALIGNKQVGKTTIAQYLVNNFFYMVKISFSDPLKQMLVNAGMCTAKEVYEMKTKRSRWLLQKIGTDIFRNQIDPDYWTNKLQKRIELFYSSWGKSIVVDDTRFPGELKMLKDNFRAISIKILRPGYGVDDSHESESYISNLKADYEIINDGSLQDLYSKIDVILTKYKTNKI